MVTYKEYKEAVRKVIEYEKAHPMRAIVAAKLRSKYSRQQLINIFERCVYAGLTKSSDKMHFISIFAYGATQKVSWYGTKIHGGQRALFDLMYRITGKVFTIPEIHDYFDLDEKLKLNDCDIENGAIKRSRIGNRIFAVI